MNDAAFFCGACGTRQPVPVASPPPLPVAVDPLANITPRTFSMLCYIPLIGWVASVIVLGARRYRTDLTLRFHAFQGLYIFAAWLLIDWAIKPVFASLPRGVFRLDHLLQVVVLGLWVLMLIKTYQGESYALPLLGELAQRSAHEKS